MIEGGRLGLIGGQFDGRCDHDGALRGRAFHGMILAATVATARPGLRTVSLAPLIARIAASEQAALAELYDRTAASSSALPC